MSALFWQFAYTKKSKKMEDISEKKQIIYIFLSEMTGLCFH